MLVLRIRCFDASPYARYQVFSGAFIILKYSSSKSKSRNSISSKIAW